MFSHDAHINRKCTFLSFSLFFSGWLGKCRGRGQCCVKWNINVFYSPPTSLATFFFSAGLICLYFNFIFLWAGGGGEGLVALLLPSVHTLINNGGVKYVTNNNNNNNETICKPVVIVVTQTCAKGLCMYLNVRFRGLFQNMFCFSGFVLFFYLFTDSFRSHRCPVWTV